MNDEGYTLPDTLSALAIIGLAMGGVLAGGALLARVQARTDLEVARAAGLKRASVVLEDLLGHAGPFRTRDVDFGGSPAAFDFACGARRCGARLDMSGGSVTLKVARASGLEETIALKGVAAAQFAYVGGYDSGAAWPRPTARPERLRQLAILESPSQTPLVQTALTIDQPISCEFDVVSQDCR